jgi:hypothetical protein
MARSKGGRMRPLSGVAVNRTLTLLGQNLLECWSMRPWESVPLTGGAAHRVPGSHGTIEPQLDNAPIANEWLPGPVGLISHSRRARPVIGAGRRGSRIR